jgi:hypothetical protein
MCYFQKVKPGFFDLKGAALYSDISVRSLRRLITRPGGLAYYRIAGGKILVKKVDLDNLLEANRHTPMDLDRLANEILAELKN